MLYEKDKELIEKLRMHARGAYLRFSFNDVEYIITTIKQLSNLEDKIGPGGGPGLPPPIPRERPRL